MTGKTEHEEAAERGHPTGEQANTWTPLNWSLFHGARERLFRDKFNRSQAEVAGLEARVAKLEAVVLKLIGKAP